MTASSIIFEQVAAGALFCVVSDEYQQVFTKTANGGAIGVDSRDEMDAAEAAEYFGDEPLTVQQN